MAVSPDGYRAWAVASRPLRQPRRSSPTRTARSTWAAQESVAVPVPVSAVTYVMETVLAKYLLKERVNGLR